MAWETIAAGVVILSLAVLWYGLQAVALCDLHIRPRVRGDNKLLWAFAILCVPYIGALGYLSMGPTSFLPQSGRVRPARAGVTRRPAPRPTRRPLPEGAVASAPDRLPHAAGFTGRGDRRSPVGSRPGADRRGSAGLAVDPVIGTDSADLVPSRASSVRRTRPAQMPDAIRWPGSGVSQGWQHADAEVHD